MSDQNTPTTSSRPHLSRGDLVLRVALGITAVGLAFIYALSRPEVAQALTLATTKQPETFTELYFNKPQVLPKIVTAGQTATFSYHISNHEAADLTYHPRVTIVENGHVQTVPQTAVTIAKDQGKDLPLSFKALQPGETIQLIIELPTQNETISFRSHS